MSVPTPVLEARGLVKRFGHVVALNEADFDLRPNEIVAIIGDNGAGKSTLIKVLSGAFQPDDGELLLDGERVRFRSPLDARRVGIETVYQELAVAPALDIASNIFLGRELRRGGPAGRLLRALDKRAMRREAMRYLSELQIGIPSIGQAVENLSGGQRQGVAVARAAAWGRRLVIMDEPTAALGVRESSMVLELIKEVRSQGLSIVMISHNLPEVFAVADRITVLRLGRTITTMATKDTSLEAIVGMMTGAVRVGV